jgi:hypothetical protein
MCPDCKSIIGAKSTPFRQNGSKSLTQVPWNLRILRFLALSLLASLLVSGYRQMGGFMMCRLQVVLLCVLFLVGLTMPQCGFSQSLGTGRFGAQAPNTSNPVLWFLSDPDAQAVWAPFGSRAEGVPAFEDWVNKSASTGALPAFRNTLSLNCWEYVVYSMLRANKFSLSQARALYAARARGEKLSSSLGRKVGQAAYSIHGPRIEIRWPKEIMAGDVILMDEGGHVVQFTGEQDAAQRNRVVSFSPRPIWGDGSREVPLDSVKPEVTTVESLIEEMIELYPDVPTDWQDINLKIVRLSQID